MPAHTAARLYFEDKQLKQNYERNDSDEKYLQKGYSLDSNRCDRNCNDNACLRRIIKKPHLIKRCGNFFTKWLDYQHLYA